MKTSRAVGILSLFALLLAAPIAAPAAPVTNSDWEMTGSWRQQFYESGIGFFDKVEAVMLSTGVFFENPTFTDLSTGGWSGTTVSPTYAYATGTPEDILYFFLHFAGPPSTPLEFVFVAWNGDIVRDAADAKWDGNGSWDITAYTGDVNDLNRTPVPEPCTMLLLGSGLVGVAAFRRKSGKA